MVFPALSLLNSSVVALGYTSFYVIFVKAKPNKCYLEVNDLSFTLVIIGKKNKNV